jgi:hypothetical protein
MHLQSRMTIKTLLSQILRVILSSLSRSDVSSVTTNILNPSKELWTQLACNTYQFAINVIFSSVQLWKVPALSTPIACFDLCSSFSKHYDPRSTRTLIGLRFQHVPVCLARIYFSTTSKLAERGIPMDTAASALPPSRTLDKFEELPRALQEMIRKAACLHRFY